MEKKKSNWSIKKNKHLWQECTKETEIVMKTV